MARIKRLAVKQEPSFWPHRYAVLITKGKNRGVRYCYSLKGRENSVQDVKRQAGPGSKLEVFKITHEFKEAWQK